MFNCPTCGIKLEDMVGEDGTWWKCIYCKKYFHLPQLKLMILRE